MHFCFVLSRNKLVETSSAMATATLAAPQPKSLIRPTHWSKEVENAYRFQLAGYRDEQEYRTVRQVTEVR